MEKNRIYRIYGKEYKAMTKRLLAESRLADIIDDRNLCVGIKPNLVTPSPASYGATTHPEIVEGIVEYLQECGFSNILIAEGSWVGDKTAEAFKYCGYEELAQKHNIRIVDTQKDSSHPVDCGNGLTLNVCDVVSEIDFLINVPVIKGHCQTRMTCALKNMKGLIPNTEKRRFHAMGLHEPIAYLQRAIHQDFIVVDHICGDLDFEEGGNPIVKNCIMTGLDPLLIDAYACKVLGYTPADVRYLELAGELGLGNNDIDSADIVTIGKGIADDNEEIHHSVLEVSYAANEVDSCSACYASLTGALIRLKEEGLLEKLDEKIAIGQGFAGKTGKLGVGRCTGKFEINIPGCPPKEDDIYEGLKKVIGGA